MTHEKPLHRLIRASDVFEFTPEENTYYRLSDNRFQSIFDDEQTLIHAAGIQGNSYGECLSLTLSREKNDNHCALTFYGLGIDSERNVWFTDAWYWYPPHQLDTALHQHLPKILVNELIKERRKRVEQTAHLHEYPRWFPLIMNDYRLTRE